MLHAVRSAIARLGQIFTRKRLEREQDEEFAFHLDMEIAHNKRLGMSEEEARRAALLSFGGRERFREETRDARGVVLLDNLGRDVRFALRRLRRAPGFATGAIVTLGVGIGTAVGIGTIVYGVLLRDLPYHEPDRLVHVSLHVPDAVAGNDKLTSAVYVHLATVARSFSAMSASSVMDAISITDDNPERVTSGSVTPNTFGMLEVGPVIGQLFETTDTAWVGPRVPILISERLWRRRFGADTSVIGRVIPMSHGERQVIGVLPSRLDFPLPSVDVWYPANVSTRRPALTGSGATVVARLHPGVAIEQAEAELNALLPSISERYPRITADDFRRAQPRIVVRPLKAAMVAPVRGHLVLLGIMVGVVLLIACTNVANLFLLRAENARPETAVAISLGASRAALAQRFVAEGVLLGAASIVVALPVAAIALTTRFGFGPHEIPRLHEIAFGLDTVVLVVTAALTLGALVGAAALTRAAATPGEVANALRGLARATRGVSWRRVQRALVTVQVAMALALLAGSALLGRSFVNLMNEPLGFEPSRTLTFGVSLPYGPTTSDPKAAVIHAEMMDRLRALPGVEGVAATQRFPLVPTRAELPLRRDGADDGRDAVASFANVASPDYFEVMGIPLRAGRTFAAGDLRAATPAIVVSQTLARSLFANADPIGRLVVYNGGQGPRNYQVVGVVGDVPAHRIEDGPSPDVYFPMLRDGDGVHPDSNPIPAGFRAMSYVIRGTPPSETTIRAIMRELSQRVPPTSIKSLDAYVADATARVRLTLLLLGVGAAAALILGVVGVYSVVSYAAAGRLREFGVRLALGDTAAGVRRLVLRDGLALASAGIVSGVALALVGGRFLRSLLYEVSPTSPHELLAAVLLLVAVTLLATLAPALKASRTDPAVVLRGD